MGIQSDLVEKRNELKSVTDKVALVRKECQVSGGDFDLMKTKALGDGDLQSRVNEMRNLKTKMDSLGAEVDGLVSAMKAFDEPAGDGAEPLGGMVHGDSRRGQVKSLGEMVIGSKEFKERQAAGNIIGFKSDFGDVELKTVMSTAAGFAPESVRTGEVVPYAVEPIGLFDRIPKGQTGQAAVVYMEQTTRTLAAAEATESTGALAESALAYTERSVTVQNIGHFIPVTSAQLEDVPQIRSIIDSEMRQGLLERLDYQVINGNGSAPNVLGALSVSGIQSQAKDGSTLDSIYKAMTLIGKNAFANANLVVMNGEDWEPVMLMKTDDGQYIWGHPSEGGPARAWGRQVIPTYRLAKGTALVGDFSKMSYYEKRGILVEISDSHDTYFIYNKLAIKATVRGCFVWKRPAAFCKVTGI
jgi:HK97 family phage major capsid protein